MGETPLGRPRAQELLWRLTFFLLAGAIALLALLPDLQFPKLGLPPGANDLLQHFLAFAALGAAGGLAWRAPRATLAGIGGFAVLLELSQAFAPGREVHLHDALAGIAGATAGAALIVGWRMLRGAEAE